MLRFPAALAAACLLLTPAVAGAAKTYDDPWLEGDLEQLRVPEALDILARTPDRVTVGVVDSGARLDDPDLAPHLLKMSGPYTCQSEYGPGPSYGADPANGDFGCDFIGSGTEQTPATTSPDGDPTDPFGHGTGVAAIIAAVPDNGLEGAGVAPNARVLPVRACYGGNPDCFNEPALDGVTYAVDMGATVINASWPPGDIPNNAQFAQYVHDHSDVLFVFAIGGSDQNSDPYDLCTKDATYPNVICVGLVNPDDGAGTTNAQKSTDVSAPGDAGVPNADGTRGELGYTSGATAHVSGVAALLLGIDPELTPKQIRDVLVSTSRAHAGYATANQAGGIVDAEAAVKAVQSMAGLVTPAPGNGAPADTPNPFTSLAAPAATPAATAAPAATASPAPSPAPVATARPTVRIRAHARRVRAGHALTLRLAIGHGPVTVTATLRRGQRLVARARRRGAHGRITLKVKVPRKTRRGVLRVTVTAGSAVARTKVRVR